MKKYFMMLAATMLTATMSAQNTAITANKFGDNWYIGLNAGAASTPWLTEYDEGNAFKFKGFAPNASLRIGKNLTTVFGLALEGTAYFKANQKSKLHTKTFVNATNVSLLGTFNLSNLFGTYMGEPRTFEVIALGGFGWMHAFGATPKTNLVTSKFAIDLALNLGSDKQWQLYLEPNIVFGLDGWYGGSKDNIQNGMKYDFNDAMLGLNIGVNYKFGCSNGTHNFASAQLRNQGEINNLNARINELRNTIQVKDGQLTEKDNRIEELETALDECKKKPAVVVEEVIKKENVLQPIVIFGQGKSTIDPAQYASIEMIAKYMRNHKDAKILVRGFASPEGNPELNQKLSVARAVSVMTALINKYKISPDRISIEGMGATDKLSEEIDFNRVAMFIDTTK
jgi:outer membrane protein OmpA-like peptidoglycan-associated protein